MKNDHVADARHPGKTALLQWLNGADPGNLPVLRSQPETVRDFLPEQHNRCGRNVNHPEPNALDHNDASCERYPDWRRRDRKLTHSSRHRVRGERRRRNSSGCQRSRELRPVARPASSHHSMVADAHPTNNLFDLSATVPQSDAPLKPPLTVSSRRT